MTWCKIKPASGPLHYVYLFYEKLLHTVLLLGCRLIVADAGVLKKAIVTVIFAYL
jgi:hypothetical protein